MFKSVSNVVKNIENAAYLFGYLVSLNMLYL